MNDKMCRYCIQKFRPSRYHPDQQVCSSADCQRRRRTDYHRQKLIEDPAYREQCLDSQKKGHGETASLMSESLLFYSALKNTIDYHHKKASG